MYKFATNVVLLHNLGK